MLTVLHHSSPTRRSAVLGDDSEAPPGETMRRLRALAGEGRPITTMVFPGTDHGIVAFETGADGKRSETRYAEGYLRMLADWIGDGRLDHPPYGNAKLLAAPSTSTTP